MTARATSSAGSGHDLGCNDIGHRSYGRGRGGETDRTTIIPKPSSPTHMAGEQHRSQQGIEWPTGSHITAKLLGHSVATMMGYAAIYPEDVITHHRAFIARRRAQRPAEEYRALTPEEWDQFLHHFELRKVALGVCTRDFGTACAHEHSCIRCPLLRPDPDQRLRLVRS